MPDWKAIAEARQLGIPPEEIAGFAPALDSLEESFRPLVRRLDYSDEP